MNILNTLKAPIHFRILISLLLLNFLLLPYAHSSSLLNSRILEYSALYPDIYFLHLQGNEQSAELVMLPEQLGEGAVNVDYEHDPVVRGDLLQMQFMRIKYLLGNRIPSATLFKTGKHAAYRQPYVCAITLDEAQFLNHPNASAEFMLSDYMQDRLPVKNLSKFDNKTFLLYTLDHEIYHCLDAYLHGHSISKDTDETKASYEHFLSEYRADLYASLISRQSRPSDLTFLRLLASYRIMGLVDIDTEHYTVAAIRQVIDMPVSDIRKKTIVDMAASIRELARESEPGITEYSQLINAARGLALYLGIEYEEVKDINNPQQDLVTTHKLKLIIQEFEDARSHITSNIYLGDNSDYMH